MSPIADVDPFAVTADPAAYVPRPACESALDALERAVREGAGPCVLTGPVGIGKSLLLRVLERRMGDVYTFVVLPYAALDLEDLARWALGVLGRPPAPGDDAPAELLEVAERLATGRGALVLMLDDASALAPDVARALVELAERSGGALRLVLVPVDDGRAGRVLAALGPRAVHVRLREPLSPDESARFVRARLERAAAPPDVLARFDPDTLARLHALAVGNPRRLQILAASVLRGRPLADLLDEAHGEPGAVDVSTRPLEEAPRPETDAGEEGATSPDRRGSAMAAAVAAAVVLVFLSLVGLAWWLSPTAGPRDEAAAQEAPLSAPASPPGAGAG